MAKKELTTSERLKALFDLQKIDSEIDRINQLKGELPMEVEDLKDEIEGLNTRVAKIEEELNGIEEELGQRDISIKNSNELIGKYEKQMDNVKNNREFEALTKEVTMQKLEIQLAEKKIREAKDQLEIRKGVLADTKELITKRETALENKKKELEEITQETDKEIEKLNKRRTKAEKNVDERLTKAYARIRKAYQNGMAVVSVKRDACGGCFAKIPPQVQIDIQSEKKVLVCEHCGRIFVPDYDAATAE